MRIGRSGINVSVVGLGAWAIGGDGNWGYSDDSESIRTIHQAHDLGVTLVDTAPGYGFGHSEEIVGKALQGRRPDYILSTKGGIRWDISEGAFHMERDGIRTVRNTKPERLSEGIEQSLKRLKTDYLDIFIVHWQALPEFPVPISDTMDFLARMKKEGKIRAIGASNLNEEQFIEYVNCGGLDIIQEKYSMIDRVNGNKFFDLCDKNTVTFQCYSPLERGILSGKYKLNTPVNMGFAKKRIKWYEKENLIKIIELTKKWEPLCKKYGCPMAQLVIAWTAAQGNGRNVHVLVGARTTSQIKENSGGGDIHLTETDIVSMRKDVESFS
jgi:methylglyoxal reductase